MTVQSITKLMQIQVTTSSPTAEAPGQLRRWVSEREFAERHGLARQTLTQWRYQDRLAGRDSARPGFPAYRRFGRAVRYLVEEG